jgi:hypothetical protein
LVALSIQQLIAAQLQHLLKQPRDGLTPPKVIFYKTRFGAAKSASRNVRASILTGLFKLIQGRRHQGKQRHFKKPFFIPNPTPHQNPQTQHPKPLNHNPIQSKTVQNPRYEIVQYS